MVEELGKYLFAPTSLIMIRTNIYVDSSFIL